MVTKTPDEKYDRIISVGVELTDEGEDDYFTITYRSGKKLRTTGKLTEETNKLIRHLQAEVMFK